MWKCKKCNLTLNLQNIIYPIHCPCGYIDFGDNTQKTNIKFGTSLIKSIPKPLMVIQASDPIQEERLSICKSCEFYKNESGEPSCGQCGCSLKTKISIAEESCPLQKWAAIKTQSSGGCGCGKK